MERIQQYAPRRRRGQDCRRYQPPQHRVSRRQPISQEGRGRRQGRQPVPPYRQFSYRHCPHQFVRYRDGDEHQRRLIRKRRTVQMNQIFQQRQLGCSGSIYQPRTAGIPATAVPAGPDAAQAGVGVKWGLYPVYQHGDLTIYAVRQAPQLLPHQLQTGIGIEQRQWRLASKYRQRAAQPPVEFTLIGENGRPPRAQLPQ